MEDIDIGEGGRLKWDPNFLSKEEADDLFEHLMKTCNWVHGEVPFYGTHTKVLTPRLQSWMAYEDTVVKDLFQKQKQIVWTDKVKITKEKLEKMLNCKFDYVLLNLYRNGKDMIAYHSDGEAIPEGKNIIASISLGETRKFLMKPKSVLKKNDENNHSLDIKEERIVEYKLNHGSLIVMLGDTQKYWRHSIPKEESITKPRINMTFRIV